MCSEDDYIGFNQDDDDIVVQNFFYQEDETPRNKAKMDYKEYEYNPHNTTAEEKEVVSRYLDHLSTIPEEDIKKTDNPCTNKEPSLDIDNLVPNAVDEKISDNIFTDPEITHEVFEPTGDNFENAIGEDFHAAEITEDYFDDPKENNEEILNNLYEKKGFSKFLYDTFDFELPHQLHNRKKQKVEKDKKRKFISKLFEDNEYAKTTKLIIKIIIFVVTLYLQMIIFTKISHMHNPFSPELKLSLPHLIGINVINSPLSLLAMAVTSFVVVIFISGKINKTIISDQNDLNISDNITHGSARFLSETEKLKVMIETSYDKLEGIILGRDNNGNALCLPNKTRKNNHVAVIGDSGAGKSRTFVRVMIIIRLILRQSYIVTDTSGELYKDTAYLAKKLGFFTKVLNMVHHSASDSWHMLKSVIEANMVEAENAAAILAHTIIANTDIGEDTDVFWDRNERSCLKGIILFVSKSPIFSDQERTMEKVYELILRLSEAVTIEKRAHYPLDQEILGNFKLTDKNRPIWFAPYKIFADDYSLRSNVAKGLQIRLEVFQSQEVCNATSFNEIDIKEAGRKPCAYYIITSDQHSTYDFITSVFFSFAFIDLVSEAQKQMNNRLKVPVFLLLDEFISLGYILDFGKKMSNVRKYGINISILLQDLGQFERKYPLKEWISMLSACHTQLYLGVNDPNTAEYVSIISGDATVNGQMTRRNEPTFAKAAFIATREDVSQMEVKRRLVTVDEAMNPEPEDTVFIKIKGKRMYKALKYDYSLHPLGSFIDNPENKRDPAMHIPNRILNRQSSVEHEIFENMKNQKESMRKSLENEGMDDSSYIKSSEEISLDDVNTLLNVADSFKEKNIMNNDPKVEPSQKNPDNSKDQITFTEKEELEKW